MPPRPSSSICSRCSHRLQWQRYSSSTVQRQSVPPESPNFIHVPEPVQAPSYEKRRPVKGTLPVPRNAFSKHREYRASEAFKAKATPEPMPRPEPHGPEAERIKYDRQLAFIRRQNMREGLSEIWARREKTRDALAKSSGLKRLRNARAAAAPAALDEVLTNPSIHPSTRLLLATGNVPGPAQQRSSSKFKLLELRKSAARHEALHNLYVNAQHFIVNEKQLNEEIDRVFGSDEVPIRWEGKHNGIWGLKDKPRTAAEMLSIENKGLAAVADVGAQERMKKIAEVLTGGKMSSIGGPQTPKA
ncbi:uncharacterized protein PV09_01991 [Verruconis gallopava]|uniref:Uncharacterized protein n=1 Tax=Verruconis gallopava TaxID=253628 RepID=A0A0D1XWH6_9PEZI|nr:uncharacterized protein PV09_01991 [Verruconis gallopava]KIW07116.1 hypothetical protein PV09_01991 [Verruconis gallopava]